MNRKAALSVLLYSLMGVGPVATQAQGMLPGCQLEDGTLQCVPGLTADPETQIKILNKKISTEVQEEGHIQQTIKGLKSFILVGEAEKGQLLRTELDINGEQFKTVQIHWYQRRDQGDWQLIATPSDKTYRIKDDNRGSEIMAILVVTSNDDEVKRARSNVLGPIP